MRCEELSRSLERPLRVVLDIEERFAYNPTFESVYSMVPSVPALLLLLIPAILMAVSIVATALVLVLPRLLLKARLPKQKGVLTFLWYFLCLGAGYVLIQVALVQKFILLLDITRVLSLAELRAAAELRPADPDRTGAKEAPGS